MKKKTNFKKLDAIVDKHKDDPGALITILQEAQDIYGYLSEDVLERISNHTGTKLSQIYGVATFYSQFRLHPHGKHTVCVCHGTACHVSGAQAITSAVSEELGIEDGETTSDKRFTLESVVCVGACSLAPVMIIDRRAHGRLTPQAAREVIKKYEKR